MPTKNQPTLNLIQDSLMKSENKWVKYVKPNSRNNSLNTSTLY